jgi:hypothetical protein
LDFDPERAGSLERGRHQDGQIERHLDDDVHDQVAEPLEHQQRNDQAPAEDPDRSPACGERKGPHRPGQPGAAQLGEPLHHPVVGGGDRQRGTVPARGKVIANTTMSARVATSQPALLTWKVRGSGGGAPVGRRLRRDERTVEMTLVPS